MSIEYTFEVVAVDIQAKSMEILYKSEGRQDMLIGTRLPYENETLEDIVRMYEPVSYWIQQDLNVIVPEVGTKGTITPTIEEPAQVINENGPVFEVGTDTVVVKSV